MNHLILANETTGTTPWWIYLVIILGVLLLVFLYNLIAFLLMKGAYKKMRKEYEKVTPIEKDRLELILDVKDALVDDHRYLPKNMEETIKETEELANKPALQVEKLKGQNDFLILYLEKYLEKKGLVKNGNYSSYYEKLKKSIYLDPQDKTSPYYAYNKKALHYNAFLGMTALGFFNRGGKYKSAPVL